MPLGLTPGLAVAVVAVAALVTANLLGSGGGMRPLATQASLALLTGGAAGLLLGLLWLAWRILVLH